MIPTREQALLLWDKYHLPEKKRIHVDLVTKVALFLADQLERHDKSIHIETKLLEVGALLHDIDKAIEKLPGEYHPTTGVRILQEEHMEEVAGLIRYHSVQYIENEETKPKTWEEKILFLADKMVKLEVITVDKRFALWLDETDLPEEQKIMLRRIYPLVKSLERDIFTIIGINPSDVVQYIR